MNHAPVRRKPVIVGWLTAAVVLALVLAPAAVGGAEEEKPSFFKSLLKRVTPGDDPPAKEQRDDVRVREITKVAPVGSVVLDKQCADMVASYKLTENLLSLGLFTVKTGVHAVVSNVMRGQGLKTVKDDLFVAAKLGAKQFNWLPMPAEVLYGEHLHEDVQADVLPRDDPGAPEHYAIADAMLQEILSKITEPHEYEFKLFILKDSGHNAVARPGGFIYVDRGLIQDRALHAKAYFALSHEVSHVLQRHETKDLQSTIVDSIPSREDLIKLIADLSRNPRAILAHVKLRKDLFTRHFIDQELQADSCGARMLSRALPEPGRLAGALRAFIKDLALPERTPPRPQPKTDAEKLAASAQEIVDTPVKRHPTSEERVRNLNVIYDEITRKGPATRLP